jgi:anthranilate synthase/aminodeoxychorismate synthase-like glutamine amidotransferase
MVLVIDNYDSFTYNLVQYLGELRAEVQVVRNDALTVEEVLRLAPERIVLSPGPCTPNEAGICVPLIRAAAGKIPILGVCLGHQAIGAAFGGEIVRALRPMHGKTSLVHHTGAGVFRGLPNPLRVIRYHSLVIRRESLPAELEITAETHEGEIMGVRHRHHPIEGVQFHPESIMSEAGMELLQNFLSGR